MIVAYTVPDLRQLSSASSGAVRRRTGGGRRGANSCIIENDYHRRDWFRYTVATGSLCDLEGQLLILPLNS
jgi:hypothetical protein